MNFYPVRDFLVVKPLESNETVTSAGIVLPESSKKGNLRGEVIRLGEGRWNAQHQTFNGFSCDKGDTVLFNEFAGFEMVINGVEYRVIRDVDILGVFKN